MEGLDFSDLISKNKALDCALNYVDKRRRTERQVRDKLRERGFSAEDIDYAVYRLHEDLLLGDEEYARDFISSRLAVKPMSSRQLEQQLIKNGIPRDMAHEALAELGDDSELESAHEAARKILRSLVRGNYDELFEGELYSEVINKTVRRLLSRGFRYEHAKTAAEAAIRELEEENCE